MNDPRHSKRLLADILAEGSAAGQRDASLSATLRLIRNRRRWRQARRGAYALALVVVGLLVFRRQVPPPEAGPEPSKPYVLVRTQPLAKAAWVETRPLAAASLISSAPNAGVLTTAGAGPPWHEISDEDLLALAAPSPAVLVRSGPGPAELVFVHSESKAVGTDEGIRGKP
jgi:hypothetical protein